MINRPTLLSLSSLLAATVLLSSGGGWANAEPTEPLATSANSAPDGVLLSAKRGELLQIIMPESREDAGDARREYYQTVFPIAEGLGYRRLGQLGIRQKVVSDYDPGAMLFFTWPDRAAQDEFKRNPQHPAIIAARPDGWNELKVFTAELDQDLDLRFDPTKYYTVVIAWLDADHGDDYQRYLTGIEPAVKRAGGRFIFKMNDPSLQTHASSPEAPGQLTFVEWDNPDGFAQVQQSQEYLDSRQYFGSGVDRFEFYWLAAVAG